MTAFRSRIRAQFVLALLATSPAFGQTADLVEPIRIDYTAPPGCPDVEAFLSQLRARTERARIVTGAERERRSFEIRVAAAGAGFSGKLTIRNEQHGSSRELAGATCADVVEAVALVTALNIDPHASTKASSELQPPAPAPTPPATSDEAPLLAPSPSAAPNADVATTAPREAADRWSVAVGLSGGARAGVLPSAAPEAMGFVAIRRKRGVLAPDIRVAILRAFSQSTSEAGASARFGFFAGRAEGCPLRVGPAELALRTCALFEVGALSANSAGVVNPQSRTDAWVAAGAGLRLAWELPRGFFVEASAEGLVPLSRERFYFGPNDLIVYRVPPVGGAVGLGLGATLFP